MFVINKNIEQTDGVLCRTITQPTVSKSPIHFQLFGPHINYVDCDCLGVDFLSFSISLVVSVFWWILAIFFISNILCSECSFALFWISSNKNVCERAHVFLLKKNRYLLIAIQLTFTHFSMLPNIERVAMEWNRAPSNLSLPSFKLAINQNVNYQFFSI